MSTHGTLVDRYASRALQANRAESSSEPAGENHIVRAEPIGRGTAEHALATGQAAPVDSDRPKWVARHPRRAQRGTDERDSLRNRLIAASLAVTLLLSAIPGTVSAQQRYVVQPGDTLESVALEFDVDPEAILRASWVQNPPYLTPGDVIIIPNPGQTPEEAALEAAENVGTSPWTVGAYRVQSGDTIQAIAAAYNVDPDELLAINGLTWSDSIYPGDRLVIPGSSAGQQNTGSIAQSVTGLPPLATSIWVPTYRQQRSLSCEYAAVFIASSAFGNPIPEQIAIDAIPVRLNPHLGYRGNIDGVWGNDTDYGVYPEPLVPILNAYGFGAEIIYSGGDPLVLKAHLDAGHPVITWLAFWGDTGRIFQDEGAYTVFAGMHVMTAFGYNEDGVAFSDPGTGTYRFLPWETFLAMWTPIDGMALAIYPA